MLRQEKGGQQPVHFEQARAGQLRPAVRSRQVAARFQAIESVPEYFADIDVELVAEIRRLRAGPS